MGRVDVHIQLDELFGQAEEYTHQLYLTNGAYTKYARKGTQLNYHSWLDHKAELKIAWRKLKSLMREANHRRHI